jgi:adenine specific DNA methylase Mod
MDEIFGKENFRNEIIISRSMQTRKAEKRLLNKTDSLFFYFSSLEYGALKILDTEKEHIKSYDLTLKVLRKLISDEIYQDIAKKLKDTFWMPFLSMPGENKINKHREIFGVKLVPPSGRHWAFSQDNLNIAIENKTARLKCKKCGLVITEQNQILNGHCKSCGSNEFEGQIYSLYNQINNNWTDIEGYEQDPDFPTKNSEILLKRVIESTSNEGDLIFDFFLGSGTTTAVAHKLGRKWIGVEMGEHFYSVVLPRMKRVLAYDKSGISKEVKEYQGGGFFKYYELEQYEEALANCKYEDSDLFNSPSETPYQEYVFMKDEKMLECMEIDYENNKVKVDLDKLYPNIDIAETLSNLTGKWIKKISYDKVEFEDETKIDTKDLDYKLIKPLIWWE